MTSSSRTDEDDKSDLGHAFWPSLRHAREMAQDARLYWICVKRARELKATVGVDDPEFLELADEIAVIYDYTSWPALRNRILTDVRACPDKLPCFRALEATP